MAETFLPLDALYQDPVDVFGFNSSSVRVVMRRGEHESDLTDEDYDGLLEDDALASDIADAGLRDEPEEIDLGVSAEDVEPLTEQLDVLDFTSLETAHGDPLEVENSSAESEQQSQAVETFSDEGEARVIVSEFYLNSDGQFVARAEHNGEEYLYRDMVTLSGEEALAQYDAAVAGVLAGEDSFTLRVLDESRVEPGFEFFHVIVFTRIDETRFLVIQDYDKVSLYIPVESPDGEDEGDVDTSEELQDVPRRENSPVAADHAGIGEAPKHFTSESASISPLSATSDLGKSDRYLVDQELKSLIQPDVIGNSGLIHEVMSDSENGGESMEPADQHILPQPALKETSRITTSRQTELVTLPLSGELYLPSLLVQTREFPIPIEEGDAVSLDVDGGPLTAIFKTLAIQKVVSEQLGAEVVEKTSELLVVQEYPEPLEEQGNDGAVLPVVGGPGGGHSHLDAAPSFGDREDVASEDPQLDVMVSSKDSLDSLTLADGGVVLPVMPPVTEVLLHQDTIMSGPVILLAQSSMETSAGIAVVEETTLDLGVAVKQSVMPDSVRSAAVDEPLAEVVMGAESAVAVSQEGMSIQERPLADQDGFEPFMAATEVAPRDNLTEVPHIETVNVLNAERVVAQEVSYDAKSVAPDAQAREAVAVDTGSVEAFSAATLDIDAWWQSFRRPSEATTVTPEVLPALGAGRRQGGDIVVEIDDAGVSRAYTTQQNQRQV
jgi:hypothetical protein